MSCNCKKVNKLVNDIPNANDKIFERKGILKYIIMFLKYLKIIFFKLLITFALIIICPLVFVILIFNLFFIGKTTIKVPKKTFNKMISKYKK